MTTPQSGREAFEALVEKWRRQTEGNYTERANCMRRCADELEAALAQQGREVGEAVAWLCESGDGNVDATPREFVRDDYARFGRKITPLYTAAPKQQDDACPSCHRAWSENRLGYSASRCKQKPAPKQQAVEVTEEMVEAFAHKVFDDANDIYGCGETDAYRDALVMAVRENIALLAALPGKTEVDRG